MKKPIIYISIFAIIAIGILLLFNRGSSLPKNELSFLKQEGFVEKGKELKSPNLIEQTLDSPDEGFEVLTTKLDLVNHIYQLVFKLENRSNQEKEFFLIPVSENNQLEFQEIRGTVGKEEILIQTSEKEPLGKLYNVEKHKQELRSELAQAYTDIENNNYTAKPIKIVLQPESTLVAKSIWKTKENKSLKPVYFLIHGSAAGVKEELLILNVQSHPQAGDNWTVEFTTKGTADLIITPLDQATINDISFVSLKCGQKEMKPQILNNDIIYYPNWECPEIGEIVHLVNVAAKHALKFQFNDQISYAYNDPATNFIRTGGGIRMHGGIGMMGAGPIKSSPSWTCGDTLIDTRDSKEYDTVLIGSQCWMAENINVGTMTAGTNEQGTNCPSAAEIEKYCYSDSEAICTLEGGLYQWAQTMCGAASCNGSGAPPNDACVSPVQGICPDGWHIPSHYEWTTLELEVCDSASCATDFPYDDTTTGYRGTDEGRQLKNCRTVQSGGVPAAPCGVLTTDWPRWDYNATCYGTDTHGFSAYAVGYRVTSGSFYGRGAYAYVWSSLESGTSAWPRGLNSGYATVSRHAGSELDGFSVRCIKD